MPNIKNVLFRTLREEMKLKRVLLAGVFFSAFSVFASATNDFYDVGQREPCRAQRKAIEGKIQEIEKLISQADEWSNAEAVGVTDKLARDVKNLLATDCWATEEFQLPMELFMKERHYYVGSTLKNMNKTFLECVQYRLLKITSSINAWLKKLYNED